MSAARVTIAASAIGLAFLLAQSSCLALLCYEDETCADGAGGTTASATTAQAMATAASTDSVTSSTSSQGGGGGAPCSDDLQTDVANCGACGHDCASGGCVDGVCQPFGLDLDQFSMYPAGPVMVWQGLVLVPRAGANNGTDAEIVSVPTNYDSTTAVSPPQVSGVDTAGIWGRGDTHVYYAPQLTNNPAGLIACDSTPSCLTYSFEGWNHFNGLAQVGVRLYATIGGDALVSMNLDNGLPQATVTPVLTEGQMASMAGGLHRMFADPAGRLVWNTYGNGGCVYRESPTAFPPVVNCRGGPLGTDGPVDLSSDSAGNAFFVPFGGGAPWWLQAGSDAIAPIGRTVIRPPIAADDDFVYARAADGQDGLLVILRNSGELLTKIGTNPIGTMDASHSDFVFFTQSAMGMDNNILFRVRKPLPPAP